jgi:hypothetical protein
MTLALAGILFVLAFTSYPAQAVDNIALSSSSASISFTGINSLKSVTMSLGNCNVVSVGTCDTNGIASGSGIIAGQNGFYHVWDNITDTIKLTLTNGALGLWDVTMPDAKFCFTSSNSSGRCSGTNFLSGTLQLVNIQQIPGSSRGDTNYQTTINLNNLAGVDAPIFAPGTSLNLSLAFPGHKNLQALLSNTHSINGVYVSSGATGPARSAPEPASLALFGTGMIVFGGCLRRRRKAVSQHDFSR